MKITKVCNKCGSNEVRLDAWAAWFEDEQQWVLEETYDAAFCMTCEDACGIEDKPMPEPADTTDYMATWEAMLAAKDSNPLLKKIWGERGTCEMRSLCTTVTDAAVMVFNSLTDDERETLGAFDWEYLPAYIDKITSFEPLILPDPSHFQQ